MIEDAKENVGAAVVVGLVDVEKINVFSCFVTRLEELGSILGLESLV